MRSSFNSANLTAANFQIENADKAYFFKTNFSFSKINDYRTGISISSLERISILYETEIGDKYYSNDSGKTLHDE